MTPDMVMSVAERALVVALALAAPVLLTSLVAGLVIGAFQAATQINESTLSFIPKLAAITLVLVFAGPWMLKILISYTHELFASIPRLIG